MGISVVSIDFWNTLYRHRGTSEFRRDVRGKYLTEKCVRLGIDSPEKLGGCFFEIVDKFVKQRWQDGKVPTRKDILENCFSYSEWRVPIAVFSELLDELYNLYRGRLKPISYPNALSFLKHICGSHPVYLISDTFTIVGNVIDSILQDDGALDCFKGRLYSDAIGVQKPDPSAIHIIADRERIDTEQILHIGDLVERDYEMCKAVGSKFILLTHNGAAATIPEPKDYTGFLGSCRNFEELRNLLRRMLECDD